MSVERPRLVAAFPHVDFPLTIAPRYNIAPTQEVLTLRLANGGPQAELIRWGIGLTSRRAGPTAGPSPPSRPPSGPIAGSWPASLRRSVINVRSERVVGAGLFRQMLDRSRALLPASHFYEWQGRAAARRPVLIGSRSGLMAFAALVGRWTDPVSDRTVPAVTILTCPPNSLVAPLHDRMPVVLDPAAWQTWLDPGAGAEDVAGLLVPCPDSWLEVRPASRLVNDPRNEGPELLVAEDAGSTPPDAVLQLSLLEEP